MTILTFKHYSFLSILLAGGALINSATIHEQFYPTIIYLTNQKSNKLIMLNFFFMISLALFRTIISVFFGEIREIERLSILDNLKRKIFDLIFIIIIYKEDSVDQSFYIWMIILGFIWVIHQITTKRSEYLLAESITDASLHMKLTFMYVLLICLDSCIIRYMFKAYPSNANDPSGYFFLFFLEYTLISLNIIYPSIKYFINAFEMFTYSHYQNKNNILMVLEFIITISKLTIQLYMRFKYLFITPFIVDFLENIVQLYNTVVKFFSSVKLLRLLNKLPDVQIEDIEEIDNTCLICLSEIKEGKKIGCGHVFHKNCLKELIQGKTNQLCPKCRKPINIEQAIKDYKNNSNNKKKNSSQIITQINIVSNQDQSQNNQNNKAGEAQNNIEAQPFSFFFSDKNDNEGNPLQASIKSLEELINNIGKLLLDQKNEPKVIQKVKGLIHDIILLDEMTKTESQKKLSGENNLKSVLNLSHLLQNSNTSLKKCGAISYGLPKIACYNRSLNDECLRKKVELMNLLLVNCQRDLLFQTMFFGATNNLLNQHNQSEDNEQMEEIKIQNNSAAAATKNSQIQFQQEPVKISSSILESQNTENDEKERKLAWIERLQSQISQTSELQEPNQLNPSQSTEKNI